MDFSRTLSTAFLPYALCYLTLISGDTQQHFSVPLNFPWLPRLVPASLWLPLLYNVFQCLHNVLLCWILHLSRLVIFSGVVVFSGVFSFPTALPVSLQSSLLQYLFAMPSQCSPLEIFIAGASLLLLELPRLPWSFAVFPRVPRSSLEFSSLCQSSFLSAGAPPCLPEFLLLPQSPFPSEFFGDSLQGFPCLPRAFLSSPMMLLSRHSFAVP